MFRMQFVRACLLVLLFVLALSVTAQAASTERSSAKADLLVMSFNIRYGSANDGANNWDQRKDMACEVVRRQNPDLIGLQEALRAQIDDLRAALAEYAEIGCGRDDGKTQGEYSGILYRKDRFELTESGTFWLSDTPEVPGSITWGNACTRLCTWGRFVPKPSGKPFYMYNTHLDHISQLSREKGIALIMARVKNRPHPDPVILTGDLNSGETNAVVRYLRGEHQLKAANNGLSQNPLPLVDTFRVLHKDASDVGTAHGFKGGCTGSKIDYIFAQPDVQILQAEILHDNQDNRYPSDHFPVTAALRWPTQRND
jgi:endonuclease/exonuclease/phosphatase family metal-dependent hydrolase